MYSLLMLLVMVGAAASQGDFTAIVFPGSPVADPRPPEPPAADPIPPEPPVAGPFLPEPPVVDPLPPEKSKSLVHHTDFGSDYHYSWKDSSEIFAWQDAQSYCTNLPGEWDLISIETHDENEWVKSVLEKEAQSYIWTSGTADPQHNFFWSTGDSVADLDWSSTGSQGVAQPDNFEANSEDCLAVLNNFYGDGVRWHDVACYHPKPVICERKLPLSA